MLRTKHSSTNRWFLLGLTFVLVILVGACRSKEPTPTPSPTQQVGQAKQSIQELHLIGTSWQADSFGGPDPKDQLAVIPGSRLTVNFGPLRYGGTGGCNFFLGVYDVEGESMRFHTPAMTAATCAPPEVMNQEGTYLASLRNIVAYSKEGDKLMGYTTGNQLLITFSPAPTVTLEGTVWELRFQDYGNGMLAPIVAGTEVTATFNAGQLSGSGGCNTFTSTYTLAEDGTFSTPAVVSTRMSCSEPKNIMEQEAQFFLNLQNAKKLTQVGGLLVLTDAADKPLAAFGTK